MATETTYLTCPYCGDKEAFAHPSKGKREGYCLGCEKFWYLPVELDFGERHTLCTMIYEKLKALEELQGSVWYNCSGRRTQAEETLLKLRGKILY